MLILAAALAGGFLFLGGAILFVYAALGIAVPTLPGIRTRFRGVVGLGLAMLAIVAGVGLPIALVVATMPTTDWKAYVDRAERERAATAARRRDAEAEREAEQARERAADDARWVATEVSARALIEQYSDNALAADKQYLGERLQVAGMVRNVGRDVFGAPYVALGSDSEREFRQVLCSLNKEAVERAARLGKGEAVRVRGRVSGSTLGNVSLDDCTIAP